MAYERAFTLATGEGDTPHDSPIRLLGQKPPHAYYGVHDFIVHLTTMVSTEPTKVMGYVRAQALAGLQADQTPDLYGITAAGRAMRSLDQTLTSDFKRGIGCVAARLESQPEPFISAFNVDNGTAKHLAELSLDHVVFLMEQFPAR